MNFLQLYPFLMTFIFMSCQNDEEILGTYVNNANSLVVLKFSADGTFTYSKGKTVYASGRWQKKEGGWSQIILSKWKDIPDFDLLGCNKECRITVQMDGSELIFLPDDQAYNFKKVK